MSNRIFVDTNVLVYAYDRSEPEKQRQARQVLYHLGMTNAAAISTQVLSEFLVTVTLKIADPLSVDEAYESVKNYLQTWTIFDLTGLVVLEAARGVREHKLSLWDGQIWAAAHLNQISTLFSEDFGDGAVIEGVRFVNPFSVDFQIGEWVA
jgi:predicted nucleic acid-binding protein